MGQQHILIVLLGGEAGLRWWRNHGARMVRHRFGQSPTLDRTLSMKAHITVARVGHVRDVPMTERLLEALKRRGTSVGRG